jgi:glycosyltransferase involved in cell wall biosynthesis
MTDSVKSTKLVVFSPLPPTENGIADYTFELIAELSTTFSITAVIENHRTPPPQSTHFTSISVNEYISDEELYVNEIHLYQLGNNIDHAYIVPILLRRPGIVVLHDVSLHHLVDQMTLRWGDRQLYKGFLSQEYGYRGRLIADQFDQRNWRGRPIFYTLPLTRTLLSAATTVIVHSAYALTKVVAQVPDVPAQLVRHHVSRKAVDHAIAVPKHTDRLAIGVNDDRLLLVSLGFLTKAKQIGEVLNVLAACRGHLPPFHYYLVGQENKEDYNIQEQIRKYGLSGEVTITGYVDEQTFFNYANASDIIINLRYPTGGETSGTLIRALALGACVIVNDIGPFSEYPDDVCVKIPVGSEQSNSLKRELLSLGLSARRRKAYGKSASEFMKRTHSMANSARLYTRTINRARIRRATEPVLEHSFLSVYEHELRMRRMCANGYLPPLWAQLNSMPVGRRDSKLVALVGGSGGKKPSFKMYSRSNLYQFLR